MGKRNRRARSNAKKRQLKRKIDKPQTGKEGNESTEPISDLPNTPSVTTTGINPTASTNAQKSQAERRSQNREYGMRERS